MRSKPIRSRTAVTLLVVFALLLTWLGAMFCTTYVTAESVYSALGSEAYRQYAKQWVYSPANIQLSSMETDAILSRIKSCNEASVFYAPGMNADHLQWIEENPLQITLQKVEKVPLQIAVTVTDGQRNLLFESGDYLYFEALTQQQWDSGEQPGQNSAFFYTPLERNELYEPLYELHDKLGRTFEEGIMRISGYSDGEQFVPVRIDYVSRESLEPLCRQYNPDEEFPMLFADLVTQELPRDGLPWETLLQQPCTNDTPLTTVYTFSPQMTVFPDEPVTYRGNRYSSLLEALHQTKVFPEVGISSYNEEYLHRMIHFYQFYLADPEKPISNISDYDMIVTCAVYANPLKATIRSLGPVYFLTGLLTVAVGWILLSILWKKLLVPVEAAGCAMEQNWDPDRTDYFATWREPALLNYQVRVESRNRQAAQDKITRLETALSYAQTAEENRRQLTSHIAHELKTPLAIIHSYTEGLKEHIAEEKRDQYLDTILSETERMDAMVMEMLDLSRLEAGKVTLTRTSFSLGALAQTVYDTFSALAQEKQLQVQLSLSDDATVLADEARIEQVIRNFLSNAVRYTPEGGTVHIKTSTQYIRLRKTVSFCVENSGHHFSQQELEKLWDSFYQADPSRSSKGTGLGLAICKNIVSLHGGSCEAKNTDLGVEFSFTLN